VLISKLFREEKIYFKAAVLGGHLPTACGPLGHRIVHKVSPKTGKRLKENNGGNPAVFSNEDRENVKRKTDAKRQP
jgi:hypothetical protein